MEALVFNDVLLGEVWLCSGQSNMGWGMARSENAEQAIAEANHPGIRLYQTPREFSETPKERIDAQWSVTTPETVRGFSAVAYYFGRKLNAELGVPIGLLHSSWGGSRIEPWTPPLGFEGIESLVEISKKAKHFPPGFGSDPKKAKQERQYPTAMYNGMIDAHIPFAIKGVIWYQGESNRKEGMLYVDKTRALLKGWRTLFEVDFPFYFVQIAPFQYGDSDPHILPQFWEAQAEIVKQIPKTGMAVVSDATTLDDIHPPNKEVPGTRLALLALDKTYGKNVVSTGPTYKEMKVERNQVIISFSSAQGLATRDGKAPDNFEIADDSGDFFPADATIKGNRVILESPDVPKPMAVRFGWHKLATPNLMNAAGLPAVPFRATGRL
jgi:sialate O-acetylesterase